MLKPETIVLLEENIDRILSDAAVSNTFSDISTWTRKTKQKNKINKWNYMKLKGYCPAKWGHCIFF